MTENPIFEIRQKVQDEINGDYADIDDIHIGFVDNEFFAQEFCNEHKNCSYHQIHITKYKNELKGQLTDNTDLMILKIPIKKWED